ncbi:RES family NAD+ phosphorylase [Pelagimonas sp. KU-00592-HH]|uniref:RES family NAD+ phosphorylase n=1 Tax=Pelagimonas sp. KU-00592-HH TaxID=3127651 RepID=UPI00334277C0
MKFSEHDPKVILDALSIGGLGDLRRACDFADRIVNIVERAGDEEELKQGFLAYRARKDYIEEEDTQTGRLDHHPLSRDDVCAPPANKTQLGRFNAPRNPVLYLSTTPEVAIAETRALSTDTCTVAKFETLRPLRLAKLLQKGGVPIGFILNDKQTDDDWDKWLLYQTADFVSRRVSDTDRKLHYRACNLIASAFKERGFDGVAYRTSFWSNGWRDLGHSEEEESIFASNIALFDPQSATPIQAGLYRIDWKRPIAEINGNSSWTARS